MKKFLMAFMIVFMLVGVSGIAQAKHLHKESWYQAKYAAMFKNAQTEVVLSDGARVDILTAHFAIEADFASKWAESYGQAMFYALETKHNPGVLLILSGNKHYDKRMSLRLCKIVDAGPKPFLITFMNVDGSVFRTLYTYVDNTGKQRVKVIKEGKYVHLE